MHPVGFVIVVAAIAVFAVLNAVSRRRVSRMTNDQLYNQWTIDPQTGERVPAPPGHYQQHGGSGPDGGHHGHHGGGFGGGHHGDGGFGGGGHHGGGGFSGGDSGGGHHG